MVCHGRGYFYGHRDHGPFAHAEREGRSPAGADPDAARLAAQINGAQLENAVRAGDETALRGLLQGILATPEGKRFASQVLGAVDGNGR